MSAGLELACFDCPIEGVLLWLEVVEGCVFHKEATEVVQRGEDLVASAVEFLHVETHEVGWAAFTGHVEAAQVSADLLQKLVGLHDVAEAFAHFAALRVLR